MSNKIAKIENKEGDVILPVTHERAVRDSSGVTLETKLAAIGSGRFSSAFKNALLACFRNAAWATPSGASLVNQLVLAMEGHGELVSIDASYIQTKDVFPMSSLDSLRDDIIVVGTFEDLTTATITDYSLSGELSVGISTITVTCGELTDTIQVVVSSYTYQYKLSDGSLTKVALSTSWNSTVGMNLSATNNAPNVRRSFVLLSGERSFTYTAADSTFSDTSDYFPIPIPPDATEVTVAITPATMFHGEAFYVLANGEYTRLLDPGWKQGSFTHSFEAGTYSYMSINCKYNQAGNAFSAEPTEMVVTFNTNA